MDVPPCQEPNRSIFRQWKCEGKGPSCRLAKIRGRVPGGPLLSMNEAGPTCGARSWSAVPGGRGCSFWDDVARTGSGEVFV